jgi:hypothetical protein
MSDNKINEIETIEEMVRKYPNDSELGKKLREYFVAKGIFKKTIAELKEENKWYYGNRD